MKSEFSARLAVVSLRAQNLPATLHFYRDVLGLSLLPDHHQPPAFDLGDGLFLAIVEGSPAPMREAGVDAFPALAFAVPDLDAAIARLRAHGVELPWGIEHRQTERWIKFYDPAGNLLEFVQFDRPPHT